MGDDMMLVVDRKLAGAPPVYRTGSFFVISAICFFTRH